MKQPITKSFRDDQPTNPLSLLSQVYFYPCDVPVYLCNHTIWCSISLEFYDYQIPF